MIRISASHLYAYVQCPHRIWRDAHDDASLKDSPNEFVQLLWEQGFQYERQVIDEQKKEIEIMDLSQIPAEERFVKTLEAMRNKTPYIYQGCLEVDDLIGKPDLLKLEANGEYIPIDIKSGMGYKDAGNDEDEVKLKNTYAVQLWLYIDALIRLQFSSRKIGKIWDSKGRIVEYDLERAQGPRKKQTWWELYQEVLLNVRDILDKRNRTEAALASVCKLCEWYTDCKKQCFERNDITLIHEIGRSTRADFVPIAQTVRQLASIKPENYLNAKGETGIKGIGEKTLIKMNRRAKLLANNEKEPLVFERYTLPKKPIELFFDIETDPTQDIVYLHGVVERRDGELKTKFYSFHTDEVSAESEKNTWQKFWQYIRSFPEDQIVVYYYSKYERTQYRILAQKYPDVATMQEVEGFFDKTRAVDLYYDIVLKCTDWATNNYSVKTLAQHLGFKWRAENPSGAASIQWFNDWCQKKDQKVLQKILDYNEDDCKAMIVLKDCLNKFSS